MQHRSTTHRLGPVPFALAALAMLIALAPIAPAQPVQEPVALATEPVNLGNLGLSLYLPEGASAQTDEIPGGKVKMIVQPADGNWVIQIYNTRSSNLQLTAAEALDAILQQRIASGPTIRHPETGRTVPLFGAVYRVDDLRITSRNASNSEGILAARAYILRRFDGDIVNHPPAGYTVIRIAPGHFITLQLDCLEEHFEAARRVYETVIASASAADPDRQHEVRSLALSAGKLFLASIEKSDLDALMDSEPVWMRVAEPAPGGSPADAKESGYQRIDVRLGQVGELDRSKSKLNWSQADREFGYLVNLDARVLETPTVSAPPGEAVPYIDTAATFFLSRDRETESWNINIEFQGDGERQRISQTLDRRGKRVTVRTSYEGRPSDIAEYEILEDHYLSAVERVLLPRLVAQRAQDDAGAVFNLGFYTYDSTRSAITYRSERFERTLGGGWKQTTVPFQSALNWTSTLDRAGNLMTQVLPPSRTVERIELDDLHKLWTSKGLPTG